MATIPLTREAWLLFAVDAVAPIFQEKGFGVPRVRVSCAIPSTSVRGSAVGQCWGRSMSEDRFPRKSIRKLINANDERFALAA